jgi:hypothetical protein
MKVISNDRQVDNELKPVSSEKEDKREQAVCDVLREHNGINATAHVNIIDHLCLQIRCRNELYDQKG